MACVTLQAGVIGLAAADQKHESEPRREEPSHPNPPPAGPATSRPPEPRPFVAAPPAPQFSPWPNAPQPGPHDYRRQSTIYYTPQYYDQAPSYAAPAPQPFDDSSDQDLQTYTCLLPDGSRSCAITGAAGASSGDACYCQFSGTIQYGPVTTLSPHVYTCRVNDAEGCSVTGPAGVASGASCYCQLDGVVE